MVPAHAVHKAQPSMAPRRGRRQVVGHVDMVGIDVQFGVLAAEPKVEHQAVRTRQPHVAPAKGALQLARRDHFARPHR